MMESLVVSRVAGGRLLPVGLVDRSSESRPTFSYLEEYCESEGSIPLSRSLPLRKGAFEELEFRPYFEGLLPEGPIRTALAANLSASEQDYLTLLGCSGLDCIGDVVVRPITEGLFWDGGSYAPLDREELLRTFADAQALTVSNVASRLSLAGTQGKVGLAHLPGAGMDEGWLRPEAGAASTHVLKTSSISRIEELELLCMTAAESCGLRVAHAEALMLGRPVISSERFDRLARADERGLCVERLHQEDLAQAFGMSPGAKYLELEGGTYHAIAQLLYERSSMVLEDLGQLARIAVFDYLVGNCDNHLKNLSVVYAGGTLRLAPAYDIVCTTYFERFSREMGRRLGSTRSIDEVRAEDFDLLARDLGVGRRLMRRICAELRERVVPAVLDAGERLSDVVETIPYTAEDLVTDMEPRLSVLC